ncbi:MAG: homoserine kinase [Candidatus Hodarchaeales archaeon]|jgi:homoserine kinase
MEKIVVSAPATIANVGPGFDVFGFAVDSPVDIIRATKIENNPKKVVIKGTNLPELPINAKKNTAGIAAQYILDRVNADFGVEFYLEKGMGIGTGLGSSAASAAAGAKAISYFLNGQIESNILLEGCIAAEEAIDGGIHGDNAVPSLLGGFIVIPSSRNPLLCSRFLLPDNLRVILVSPPISILTAEARRIIPKNVPLKHSIHSTGYAGLVMAGIVKKDLKLMGKGIVDHIVEPIRAKLIPNFYHVKKAAMDSGAYGCSISGAGPTVFAIADQDLDLKEIGKAMAEAFKFDEPVKVRIGLPNNEGAKILARSYKF